ncbi:hypothetical protein PHYPSEUDO_012013 [Phytophthora pseudosyringae]|uniref:Myb-like DNA-binding protein n=1 Tax=Phytophthora pseudosyringae TaxID=221518 RepID=A0A8T1V7H4_9STRA|nr:hypothetical protein PHYPSEUDO_012013 [Phytophthora pseudosyringae]
MTFSTRVQSELFSTGLGESRGDIPDLAVSPRLIRLPLTRRFGTTTKRATDKIKSDSRPTSSEANGRDKPQRHGLPWTAEEHDRFLQALETYPSGPWKEVASFVGTRTARQVMTHAQKYREKIKRRRRCLFSISRKGSRWEPYCELAIRTSPSDLDLSLPDTEGKSPTAVDWQHGPFEVPQEINWFDRVSVEDMDAAFKAFLANYDSALFPMVNDTPSPFGFIVDAEHGNDVADTMGMET